MDYIVNGKTFHLIDTLERIPSKDSFTHTENKIGDGSGAWEWHIGSKRDRKNYSFWGGENFNVRCFLKKSDLIWLMEELEEEYQIPKQEYREKNRFKEIWRKRRAEIEALDEYSFFTFREHDGRDSMDQRLYAKRPGTDAEGDEIYGLIRKLALPNITFISILKIQADDGEILFYFKLFPEYIDEKIATPSDRLIISEIESSAGLRETEKLQIIKSRIGQGIFRTRLLEECVFCPITLVDDSRFLIASHIKPWKVSDNKERLFEKNGLLFTPTYDKLFDAGFISFTLDKRIIISPWVSLENKIKLNLNDGQQYPHFPITGRELFLEYHRDIIFKK